MGRIRLKISSYKLFGKEGEKNKTSLDHKSILPPIKNGGGKVMILKGAAFKGVVNLKFIVTTTIMLRYIDLLHQNLLSRARKLGIGKTSYF